MYSTRHKIYNNLEYKTYFKSSAIVAGLVYLASLGTTALINYRAQGQVYTPKSKIEIERYINNPNLSGSENTVNFLKSINKGIWVAGSVLLVHKVLIKNPTWRRLIRERKYFDLYYIPRPIRGLSFNHLRREVVPHFTSPTIFAHFIQYDKTWYHLFILSCAYFYCTNYEFNFSNLVNTYVSTAAVSSLATCAVACLAKNRVQKFTYLYGMGPGLFGLLGFEMFFHKNSGVGAANLKQLDDTNRNEKFQYKILGVESQIDETFSKIFNPETAKVFMAASLISGLLFEAFVLRIWLSGKMTGSCLAFLAGAGQGQFSRFLSELQGNGIGLGDGSGNGLNMKLVHPVLFDLEGAEYSGKVLKESESGVIPKLKPAGDES